MAGAAVRRVIARLRCRDLTLEPMTTSPATTDRRAALLAAAADRFIEVGIRKTTMEDIARLAGAGKATLYRYFANKDELIAALLDREVARLEARILRAAAAQATAPEKLAAALTAAIRFFLEHPILTRGRQEEPAELLERITASGGPLVGRIQTTFEQLIVAGLVAGELRPVDPKVTSEMLLRLSASYLAFPPHLVPVGDEVAVRDLARSIIQTSLAPTR